MSHKNQCNFWENFKIVCCGNTAVKIIAIPITLLTAQLLSTVIDQSLSGNVDIVVRNTVIILGLTVIFGVFQTGSNILLRRHQEKSVNQCRNDFLEMLLANPLNKIFRTDYGELKENLSDDIETVVGRYIELYPRIVSSVFSLLVYMIFLLVKSPVIALSLLGIALLQIIPPLIVKKYMQINYDSCQEMEEEITNHIVEAVNGFEVIKLYSLKKWWQTQMADCHRKYLEVGRRADMTAAAHISMNKLLENILQFGTYTLMGVFVLLEFCSIDVAVQAIYLSGGLYDSVKALFSTVPEIAVTVSAEKRISKWSCPDYKEMNKTAVSNDILLNDLSYSYEKRSLIRNVDYRFNADKNYLLKGNNGTGKTTLFHVLTGLVLPDSGGVSIGENFYIPQQDPEYSYDVQTLFAMFGEEKQKLFTMTAKQFGLSDENMNGRAIRELSGGERKKVFLSIGFALQPKWLLLDEPSNNLDRHGKKVLCEMLKKRKGTLVISHDSALNELMDCVIKMENGCVYDEECRNN